MAGYVIEVRDVPWPDGEPLERIDAPGTRENARRLAVDALRGNAAARLADVRLAHRLIDNYIRRRTTGSIRHLYAAPVRPVRRAEA